MKYKVWCAQAVHVTRRNVKESEGPAGVNQLDFRESCLPDPTNMEFSSLLRTGGLYRNLCIVFCYRMLVEKLSILFFLFVFVLQWYRFKWAMSHMFAVTLHLFDLLYSLSFTYCECGKRKKTILIWRRACNYKLFPQTASFNPTLGLCSSPLRRKQDMQETATYLYWVSKKMYSILIYTRLL